MTELPFDYPSAPNPGAAPPRVCRRHDWRDAGYKMDGRPLDVCSRCGVEKNAERTRRGRTNRARGNAIEREVGHRLGLKRVGQFGGATDLGVSADPFAVSVKSGSGYFSERHWRELKRQPMAAAQTALLVVTDAPGPGHRRRAVVVLDLEDWLALHGPSGVEGL